MTPRFAPAHVDDRARFDPALVFAAGLRNHHISNTAYPIAHERTFRPYRVAKRDERDVAVGAFAGVDDLCLYLHIPFCETRCSFCEYTVVGREEHERQTAYVDALLRELALWDDAIALSGRRIHGLDIGGGTPSWIDARHIARLLDEVRARCTFAAGSDISIETTPKVAATEPDKLAVYRAHGVDRISMGVQVVQPDLLRVLNRGGQGAELFRRAVDNIRRAGFARLNLDLMYGFAGQSRASWRATLEHAVALAPEYITLYRMRYKLTRIAHQASSVTLDDVRPLVRLATELLGAAGYRASPGKTTYSRVDGDVGTSSYLARRVVDGMPYLGLGLGAQSFSHTTLSYNDGAAGRRLAPYSRSTARRRLPLQDLYWLPMRHVMAKMCAVSFYFGEIDRRAFASKHGVALEDAFPDEVAFVLARGLMELAGDKLRLTDEGALFVNGVIALFFAPSVQRCLIERDPARADDRRRRGPRAPPAAAQRAEPARV